MSSPVLHALFNVAFLGKISTSGLVPATEGLTDALLRLLFIEAFAAHHSQPLSASIGRTLNMMSAYRLRTTIKGNLLLSSPSRSYRAMGAHGA